MKHGKIPKHINMLAVRIAGADSHLMKKEEFYSPQPVLLLMIFTEVSGGDKIYLPIVYLLWMLEQENASGIFNLYIMIYGTGTYLPRRYWLQLKKKPARMTPA